MNRETHFKAFFGLLILVTPIIQSIPSLFQPTDNFSLFFSGKYRPESFLGKNANLLNDTMSDLFYYSRHTLDLTFDTLYGKGTYGDNILEFKATIRNRAVWGDPASISPVTSAALIDLDADLSPHSHYIPRGFFWIRELWMGFDVGKALGLSFKNAQTFMIGSFPFLLGRGISLGEAYAVGPSTLGFYTDFNVDQFAWAAKLSGDLVKDALSYDLYIALLQNNMGSISKNIEPIYQNRIGCHEHPERGFGSAGFIAAGRLNWNIFENKCWGALHVEPYAMYNHDPEQRVEFNADAKSKLLTIGFAGEYEGNRFAFGFDTAMNLGHQHVHPWDRNRVEKQLRDGVEMRVNSHVYVGLDPLNSTGVANTDPYKVPYSPKNVVTPAGSLSSVGKQAQALINTTPKSESFNGKSIGFIPSFAADMAYIPNAVAPAQTDEFFNATNRFRNGYTNKYKGWMFVADGGLFFCEKALQLAGTAGIASGGDNPNCETFDGTYEGFIGVQEIYSGGSRVRSAFFMNAAGKVRVPFSAPKTDQAPNRFAQLTSGFTNLVFWGTGLHYTPKNVKKRVVFNPNLYMYWQDSPTHKFDLTTKKDADAFASTYLGTELNLFFDYYFFKDLKIFYVSSIFVPGQHFRDIRGKPFNSRQAGLLNSRNITCANDPNIPNISDDIAFTINVGLEYRF